jgi:hypothetical protein
MLVIIPKITIAAIATIKVIANIAAFCIAMFFSPNKDSFGCVNKSHRLFE